jgi:hypothetical protein
MKVLASAAVALVVASMGTVLGQGKYVGISENPDRTIDARRGGSRSKISLKRPFFWILRSKRSAYIDALEIIQTSAERIYLCTARIESQGIGLSMEGAMPDVKISLRGKRVSLGLALDEVCRQAGMLWTNKAYTILLKPGQRFTQRKSPFPGELEPAAGRG